MNPILIRVSLIFAFSLFFSCLLPANACPEIIVRDMIAPRSEKAVLRIETKGKFFSKGGMVVEVFIDGEFIGKTLSGGDGFAFMPFTPPKTGMYRISARSGEDKGNGLFLSLKRGIGIVFVDVDGSLFERPFSKKPRRGSQKALIEISRRYPVVFLGSGLLSLKALKTWMKENGFIDSPLLPWNEGAVFDETNDKGFRVGALIGSPRMIESAKKYRPKAFSFEETEDAIEVKDWDEIRKRLFSR